jgi:hypothetical protein
MRQQRAATYIEQSRRAEQAQAAAQLAQQLTASRRAGLGAVGSQQAAGAALAARIAQQRAQAHAQLAQAQQQRAPHASVSIGTLTRAITW